METPLISIAIPSYNYSKYLNRAFEVFRKSSFRDFEVVYCDDCSSDDSVEVIKKLIKDNPDMRISLYQNENNIGILKTKTRLFHLCTGKYVMLCDADDYLTDNCLATLAKIAIKTDADRIVSEARDIDEEGRTVQIQDIPEITSKWLWNMNHGCLYKRSVFIDNGITLDFIPDDVCLTAKFSCFSRSVAWIRRPLYNWVIHQDSAGRNQKSASNARRIVDDFRTAVKSLSDISKTRNEKDRAEIELLIVKLYYLQLFHVLKDYSMSAKLKTYSKLRAVMNKYCPEYLNNRFIRRGFLGTLLKSIAGDKRDDIPLRNYARYIILFSAFLERVHLMKPALMGYHVVSRFVKFDQ